MEITIIITVIFFCLILGFFLWKVMNLQEDVTFLKNEVEYLKILQSQEPEEKINIDYENLKQEL